MKLIVIHDIGFSQECVAEIQHFLGEKNVETFVQHCIVNNCTKEDILLYQYKTQLALKLFIILDSFEYKPESLLLDIKQSVSEYDSWDDWIDESHSFKVVAKISQDVDSIEIAKKVGSYILSTASNSFVEMVKPSVQVRVQVLETQVYLCIDITQTYLEKREYKIYTSPTALRSTIAANLCYFSKIQPGDCIYDPFCGSGTIPIECAFLLSGMSPRFYEKEQSQVIRAKPFESYTVADIAAFDSSHPVKHTLFASDILSKCVDATKKNAKIAGVLSHMSVLKVDVDWMDTKFEKGQVTKIITTPPYYSQHTQKKLSKTYHQFFERSQDILAKEGTITLLVNNELFVTDIAKKYFAHIEKRVIFMGKSELIVLLCKR